MKDYLDRLIGEYDAHLAAIDDLVTKAADDNDRPLADDEDAEVKRHQEEAEKLLPQIERYKALRETRAKGAVMRTNLPAATGPVRTTERIIETGNEPAEVDDKAVNRSLRRIHPTAGHFLHDQVVARQRGDQGAMERIQRALALQTTAQTPGLLPTPFVGDVLGRITAVRPLINSANQVPLPASGMTWKRPKITQHTNVDIQATEKTEVASRALVVGSIDADFATLAGAVNMSIQEIERTDPSALDLVFSDLAAQYGKRSELFAVEAFVDGIAASDTVSTPITSGSTVEQIRAALYEASGEIYAATDGLMPNVIYASIDQWANIGKFARQINPQDRDVLSAPDSLQVNIAGLPVVVLPSAPTGLLVAGRSEYLEVAERPGSPVELRALEVGILGYEVGVYGMIGALVTEDGAFVKLADFGS